MRLAVLGHGIAGAALARLLGAAGHQVCGYERLSEDARVGAGLLLQPMGMAVLAQMGLLDQAAALGARVDLIQAFSGGGRQILDLRYPPHGGRNFGLGLHRSVLQQLLRTAAAPYSRVHYGCAIEAVDARNGVLHGVDGSLHGPFDLIVGADGRHSVSRAAVPGARAPVEYAWGGLLCVFDDPQDHFGGRLVQRYRGAHELAVWPLGSVAAGAPRRINLSWRIAGRAPFPRDLADWKHEVVAIEPLLEPLLAQVRTTEQLLQVRYAHDSQSCWGTDRLILLGDAAHCMSPQLGQGASLALLDAMRLAQCLSAESNVDRLREYFVATREPQIRHYRRLSWVLTPLYQSTHPLPVWMREHAIPMFARSRRFHAAMLKTLTGVGTGA